MPRRRGATGGGGALRAALVWGHERLYVDRPASVQPKGLDMLIEGAEGSHSADLVELSADRLGFVDFEGISLDVARALQVACLFHLLHVVVL